MSDQLSDFLKRRYASIENDEAVEAVAPLITRLEEMYDQFKDYADPNFLSEFCGGDEQKLVQRYWEMYLVCLLLDQGRSLKPAKERPDNKGPDIQIVEDGYNICIEACTPELGEKNNRPDENYLRALGGTHEIALRNVPHGKLLLRFTNAIDTKRKKFKKYRAADLIATKDVCVIAINAGLLGPDGFDGLSQYPCAVEAVYSFRNQELVLNDSANEVVETRLTYSPTVKKSEIEIDIGVFVDGSCENISAIIAASRQPHQEIMQGARELVTVHNPHALNELAKGYVQGAIEYSLEITKNGKHKVRSTEDMSDLDALRKEIIDAAAAALSPQALDGVRVGALGKKGTITERMKGLGKLDGEARKAAGQALNALKNEVAGAIEARKAALEDAALDARLATESIDISLPIRPEAQGRIHPISQATDEVVSIFGEMGFTVAEGPDIENDWYNFTALNIPPEHPARQMHDTFYLAAGDREGAAGEGDESGGEDKDQPGILLRTHTSPVQIRTMQAVAPPIRILVPGRTYRCDSDLTHTPMFHQFEGLVIDRSTHMGHLKGCLIEFCRAYFEVEDVPVRFRPSHFPFTEPSAEVDIGCTHTRDGIEIGTGEDWLEILGCGMVHPKVLANCGIDPETYQGFAFGMGTERIAMLKYGIPDLRTFFEADLRWLRHYGFLPLEVPSLTGGLGG